MEKRIWTMPQAEVEKFEMNAYCASACGETNRVYTFTCDAGDGNVGLVTGSDGKSNHYHACGATHVTDVLVNDEMPTEFITGTYEECNRYSDWTGCSEWAGHKDPINVLIWRGEDGDNTHCTTNLNINSWETAKS